VANSKAWHPRGLLNERLLKREDFGERALLVSIPVLLISTIAEHFTDDLPTCICTVKEAIARDTNNYLEMRPVTRITLPEVFETS
jgi:hypothetical protein